MWRFTPRVMYGYTITVPETLSSEVDPDDDSDDEYSKEGSYFKTIPSVDLPKNCGLCLLMKSCEAIETRSHLPGLTGEYIIVLGVITDGLKLTDVADSLEELDELIVKDEILKRMSMSGPYFIGGMLVPP